MAKLVILFVFAVFSVLSSADDSDQRIPVSYIKECPRVKPITSFDIDAFSGKWFQSRLYGQPEVTKCNTFRFTSEDGHTISIVESSQKGVTNGVNIKFNADLPNADRGKLTIEPSGNIPLPTNSSLGHGSVYVLDSDYDNYAVLWKCGVVGTESNKAEKLWILTRDIDAEDHVMRTAEKSLNNRGLNVTRLLAQDKKDCVYETVTVTVTTLNKRTK